MTEKKTINVAKAFNLILKPGQPPVAYPAGVQQVDPEVATHWFTKLHLAGGGFGTPEHAAAARQSADAAKSKLDAMTAEWEGLETAATEAEGAAAAGEAAKEDDMKKSSKAAGKGKGADKAPVVGDPKPAAAAVESDDPKPAEDPKPEA